MFDLTYSRWISPLPSCLWSLRIFSSLPGSRLATFYRDASSALLQLVNQWLNFTYSFSHAFRYGRNNTNPTVVRIELTTSALAGVQITYYTTRPTMRCRWNMQPRCSRRGQTRGADPIDEEQAPGTKLLEISFLLDHHIKSIISICFFRDRVYARCFYFSVTVRSRLSWAYGPLHNLA